ncbi:MAG TPA: alpha/beta hydrolase [Kofleriaceae bacterium]
MVTPDEWRARGDTFEWRGHRIFYRVEGTGEPVLAIHGFPTASWDYWPIWPALVAKYRVLTLDMIGFGFSAKPRDFAYSIFAQADLYEALLAREGVTRYRLLAHDYGLTVAQELLAREAPIVACCLLNGGAFPETHRAALVQKLLASRLGPLVAKLSSYRTFARTMRGIWGERPLPESELRGMWQLVTASDGMAVMPKLIGYMAERRRHRERWVGALCKTRVPVRLIDGLVDPISGAHMVARYRELVPNPDIVELPGVGHYPQLEAPDKVVAAVLEKFA